MHSAIIVVKQPDRRSDWSSFMDALEPKLRKARGVSRLAENVWLLSFQESVAPLGWIVSLCEQRGFPYGILPLDAAPQWLPAGFDPKPN